MKVELQRGDSITIPEGCKAIVKDGSVVFEKEEKEEVQEFKDGDVLCSTLDDTILIFKETHNHDRGFFESHYNTGGKDNIGWNRLTFRHATEEEKQLLFDKMKEQGLQWNAEEKRVEKLRWRAKDGAFYYYVDNKGNLMIDREDSVYTDRNRYLFNNYFRTREQAKEAARRIKEVLHKYHEEIGE